MLAIMETTFLCNRGPFRNESILVANLYPVLDILEFATWRRPGLYDETRAL